MRCPSCLSRVSRGARMCAACGDDLSGAALVGPAESSVPTVIVPRERVLEVAGNGNGARHETLALGSVAAVAAEPASFGACFCDLCGGALEPEARFCSFCGATVDDEEPPGPREVLAARDVDAPEPALEIELEPVESETDDRPTVIRFEPRRSTPVVSEPKPGWLDRSFDVRAGAAIAATIALAFAILVHFLPGVEATGEAGLAVHLRSIEWLLGGTLVALLGLLLRR